MNKKTLMLLMVLGVLYVLTKNGSAFIPFGPTSPQGPNLPTGDQGPNLPGYAS